MDVILKCFFKGVWLFGLWFSLQTGHAFVLDTDSCWYQSFSDSWLKNEEEWVSLPHASSGESFSLAYTFDVQPHWPAALALCIERPVGRMEVILNGKYLEVHR